MNELMSPTAFAWTVTLMTGVVAGSWFIFDLRNLWRLRTANRGDAVVRDKLFGYVVGLAVGAIGVIGCLLFHDVF